MASLPIKDSDGKEVGSYEYELTDFAPEISKQLLHDVVVMYEANKRVGTVRTKSRGEIVGSTKKLYRQKGTGRARAGSKKSPVRRGGGHTFAKRPKDWSYRLPKKAVKLATRMAFRSKIEDDQIFVLDSLSVEAPKTSVIAGILKNLGVQGASNLLVIAEHDVDIWRSARNVENLWVSPVSGLNTYDLLHQRNLVVTKDALDALKQSVPATV